jgi:predicted esterase/4-amino-4-deoxy-L-arabinose transferase-like glycosyltransferase
LAGAVAEVDEQDRERAARLFEERTYAPEGNSERRKYRLLVPAHTDPAEQFPLVLFLHGGGARGDDNRHQLLTLPALLARPDYRKRFPCFVLAPQCPADRDWKREAPLVLDLLDQVLRDHPIDSRRVYLTGHSMGGGGAWSLAALRPDFFAAVVPVAGVGDWQDASVLANVPVWAVHGAADRIVPAEASQRMIAVIRQAGGSPNYTELVDVAHDGSWKYAYSLDGDVLAWMFTQRRSWLPWNLDWPMAALLGADGGLVLLFLLYGWRELSARQEFLTRPSQQRTGPQARRGRCIVAVTLVSIQTGLLAWGAWRQSPTYNEAADLVAGISHWQLGNFDVYCVNPPLTRLVATLPVLADRPKTDWRGFHDAPGARPEFPLGKDFLSANGARSLWLCTLARWACIPFSWLGAWICYRWAGELYGSTAGLLALTLWCFCPNLLAHAQLATPDAGAAAFGVAAAYVFWRWLKTPNWTWTFVAGGALGLAELTKFTWLILFALWPILWIVWRLGDAFDRGNLRTWLRQSLQLVLILALAVYVVNLGYGFDGSFQRLDKFEFVSESLRSRGADAERALIGNRFRASWLGSLPVPLPKDFVIGVDLQKKDLEHFDKPSYLRGQFRESGWWYYYLYAAGIKVPLGTWLLFVLSCAAPFLPSGGRARWRDSLVILVPPVVVFALVSSQTGLNQHFRYALPAFPFALIWISRVACVFTSRRAWLKNLVAGALTWSVASSLWIYPHSLSYFNELVGGPNGGSAHLLGSNVDWCQDLIFLKDWLAAHPEAQPLELAYFGYFDPHHIGLDYKLPPIRSGRESMKPKGAPQAAWLAISVNFLRGDSGTATAGDGQPVTIPTHAFPEWEERQPDAQAGYSISLFRLNPPQPP